MIFIINDNVRYNEKDGVLGSIKDCKNDISLLKPTARLLSLFVRNNNLLITREQLLNDVWEDYGLKASNNNLNNYISGLRKSLLHFDEEELLVTYPRQGFKFMAKTIRREDNIDEQEAIDEERLYEDHHLVTSKKRSALIRRMPWKTLVWSIAFSLLLLSAGLLYKNFTQISITSIGQYKNCRIYSIKNDGVDTEEIKSMIYHARYNCDENANIYYYGSMEARDINSRSPLLAYCPLDTLKPCEKIQVVQH